MKMMKINRISKLFQPLNVVPKNAEIKHQDITSSSQKLMLDLGIMRQANPGCFHLLPLGVRALEKLTYIITEEMASIGAQRIEMPILTSTDLWKTTGRLSGTENELFKLTDRHSKKYILSPTYEESITDLLSSVSPISYKKLPLRLYQITSKFRDEIKPRFGLMRSRQFDMKDLYTFDTTVDSANETYTEISAAYDRIFRKIGVQYVKVFGSVGDIGGSLSHEYHFPAPIGEDHLLLCDICGYTTNAELVSVSPTCVKCPPENQIRSQNGIEVGHTFLLGHRYSKPLNATYLQKNGKPALLEMGCYGLGITRMLAAALEVLSTPKQLKWPLRIAPFKVVIIPPKEGSIEEKSVIGLTDQLYHKLNSVQNLRSDVIVDDRVNMTIGKRCHEAKRIGYPFIVIIGHHATESVPIYELIDATSENNQFLNESDILGYLINKIKLE